MKRFNDAFDRAIIIVPALAFVLAVVIYANRLLAVVIAGAGAALVVGVVAYGLGLLIQKFGDK